ncbi:ABC transporter ATP-binding protein [Rarobacter faecitabidus]|uniref:ATP-binding cassette subfamily B protein n=1 Tax=Rarobacter faecitabidus TaxID=13243 RepID=A0A542ZV64_RARFA|nr:ABC transporter ATP-binding protein [Rarobacter faecitabidus]TQL64243.1 ATP-binding cassette subfamily B protein [Rarobacter faecitabidus]
MTLIRLIAKYLRPHWHLLAAVVVFQAIQTVASLYLPTLTADIIDRGVAVGDTGYVMRMGGIMLIFSGVQIAAQVAAVFFGSIVAMRFGRDSRAAIFNHVGDFSAREVADFGTPSLITRTTNDIQQVQTLVQMSTTFLISAPIMAVGGVIMALRLDMKLSWIIAIAVPILLVGVSLIISRMVPLFQRQQRLVDSVNRILREQLTGMRVLRAFVREPYEEKRFDETNHELTDISTRAGRLFALMFPFVLLALNVSSVAVIWFGAFRVRDGLEVGTLFAFLSYIVQILMAVMMTTMLTAIVPRAAVSAERVTEVLDTTTSVPDTVGAAISSRGPATLAFDHVTYRYPGAEDPVLRDVSFTIPAGSTTAIIGSTGAGKSTIVNLIARLMDATEGSIRVDGQDVRALEPESLWARIGLVPQKPLLFSGTVRSNLQYGNASASEDEISAALEIAQADGFVAQMDGGLDAPINQGGTNVSGGQRQRLAIARALVKHPDLYVFDDSFSALDTRTDAALRAALIERVPGVTKLIVAQRVATITDADQIIVLDDGKVLAIGTHEHLLATSQTYAEIVSSQLQASEAN